MNSKISILGGGVSGLTTALTLQLLGFETAIYAEYLVNDEAPRDPQFASLYPAASVIPHSIKTDKLDLILPASLKIFDALKKHDFPSLTTQRHFELYEFPIDPPAYARFMHKYDNISDIDDDLVPRRDETTPLYGWVFDCFVTAWPKYMQQLYALYQASGGRIVQKKIVKKNIEQLPGDVLINCSGTGTIALFDDNADHALIRGHLIHVKNKAPVWGAENQVYSYNYTSDPEVYSTPQGAPADVYFYPVNGKWVVGGSRQPGQLDNNGLWHGKQHSDTITVSNVDIPRQIIELNNQILSNTYGLSIDKDEPDIEVHMGYRYTRKNADKGLRLDTDEAFSKKVIHNYGHGGAGVTLSWGCALQILEMIRTATGHKPEQERPTFDNSILNYLQVWLHQVYLNDFYSSNTQN